MARIPTTEEIAAYTAQAGQQPYEYQGRMKSVYENINAYVQEEEARKQAEKAEAERIAIYDAEQKKIEEERKANEERIIQERLAKSAALGITSEAVPVEQSALEKATETVSNVFTAANTSEYSLVQNLLTMGSRRKQAVPVYGESGEIVGSRYETDEEVNQRIQRYRNLKREDLTESEKVAGDIVAVLRDPSLWAVPFGSTYTGAAVLGGTYAAAETAARNLKSTGEVDEEEVGLMAALGAVFSPAVLGGVKGLGKLYRTVFQKEGAEAALKAVEDEVAGYLPYFPTAEKVEQATRALPAPEVLKALPAPTPTKSLPAPKDATEAPITIDERGRPRSPYEPEKGFTVVEKEVPKGAATAKGSKAQQIEEMWAARKAEEIKAKEDAWTPESLQKSVKESYKAYRKGIDETQEFVDSVHPESAMARAFANAVELEDDAVRQFGKSQQGNMSVDVLAKLASTTGGAVIGGAIDGEEGALKGAAWGLGLSFVPWRPLIGKLSEWSRADRAVLSASAKWYSRPSQVLRSYGSSGEQLANMLRTARENVNLTVGKHINNLRSTMERLSTDEMAQVRKLLNHTIKPNVTTKAAKVAATAIRREMNKVLDEAAEVGVYTKEQVAQLKENARTKGYFPRIYDHIFLASDKGKEQWTRAFSETGFGSKSDMQAVLESILGTNQKAAVDKYMQYAKVNNERYSLPADKALELLNIERVRSKSGRSTHLEKGRVIPESLEQILEPFLVKDPAAVLTSYFNDTARRLEYSKLFDAPNPKDGSLNVDAVATKLFDDIGLQYGQAAKDVAKQTYYTSVGDAGGSSIIRDRQNISEAARKALEGSSSFETISKLSLAQVANGMQATVNGMTKLLNISGGNPFTSLKATLKGWKGLMTEEGREFADRAGAALETTISQIVHEGGMSGGIASRAETAFLKGTGFISVERMQRILAANMGKAFAEQLISDKAKLVRQLALKPDSKRLKNKLAATEKRMEKIGLPTKSPATAVDVERAGLRFSNETNFINSPDELPLHWQSPYAKLITKFKSFMFNQSAFVKDNVLKPLVRGNAMPLIWYTGPASVIGMGIDEVRRKIKGQPDPETFMERYLRGLTMIGGLGLVGDFFSQTVENPEYAMSSLVGPTITDSINTVYEAGQYAKGKQDEKEFLAGMLRMQTLPGTRAIIEDLEGTDW